MVLTNQPAEFPYRQQKDVSGVVNAIKCKIEKKSKKINDNKNEKKNVEKHVEKTITSSH